MCLTLIMKEIQSNDNNSEHLRKLGHNVTLVQMMEADHNSDNASLKCYSKPTSYN